MHAKALFGVLAGATATALFAGTLAVPAFSAPVDATFKIKLADAANAANVIKGKYLVETAGAPLINGGNAWANKVTQDGVKAAARFSGVRVTDAQSDIWTGLTVTATEQQVRKLAESPGVKAIYPVLRVQLPKTMASRTEVTSALADISASGTRYTGSGIRVGVIDSGIDYNHVDLGGSGKAGSDADFGSHAPRVRYGWDFVGDDYAGESAPVPDAYPDDCNGHGTHVAGIIGAAGDPDVGGALGVAPKVTLGAYRIFGCDGGTDTSIILKALARAKKDKMHVINLSVGSDFGNWPSYPEAVAASNLARSGIVVVAAAGNSGDTGLFSAGSPAVGAGVISVGSYESEKVRALAISVGANKIAYTAVDGTADAPTDNATQLTLAVASNTTACTIPTTVIANTALLIKGGGCDNTTKLASALAAGAVAVVIYKEAPGWDEYTTEPDSYTIPAISIGGTEGESLRALIATSGPQTMTWLDYQQDALNPDGGAMSTFSSAGLAADLSLVPTISAPGGKIYSTLPIEQGAHGNESGTSMSTPFVAGAVAVLMQAKPGLKGKPSLVAQLLYNTAVPVARATEQGVTTHPEAVFRQGSGLVQVQAAINAAVTASPSIIKLGQGTRQKVTVTLTNRTRRTLIYTPSLISGVSAAASTSSVSTPAVGTTSPDYVFGEVGFKSYAKKVKLKPGKSAKISLKIYSPGVLKGRAGLLYGGWVNFTTSGAGNSISIPFSGLRGDYQAVKVLNEFAVTQAGVSWPLPALGYVEADDLRPEYSNTRTYTMDQTSGDYPLVLYHLDYPASDVRVKVTNTRTRKSHYAIIDWYASSASKATHLNKQSRDDSVQYIEFDGAYLSKGRAKFLPSGAYQLQLRVLKPLGTSSRSSHWETFTTRTFNIQWWDE